MKQKLTIASLVLAGIGVWGVAFALPTGATALEPLQSQVRDEKAGLTFSQEEEKMARDVYNVLADKWGGRPFSNIARAEQQHMESVQAALQRHGFGILPAGKPGEFKDPNLQKLYHDLVKRGSVSRIEALKVGATIEDLDIDDLNRLIKEAKSPDVKIVYENLRAGSYNHMRAFVGVLQRMGATYKPQYISQAEFESILKGTGGTGGPGRGGFRGGRGSGVG